MLRSGSYLAATRHPWSCVTFVLPLLVAYEAGLYCLGTDEPDSLRNGADTWLRWGLSRVGFAETLWAPVLLVGILVAWSLFRRQDRPRDYLSVWIGMAIESGLFALGLWAMSRGVWPVLDGLGFHPEPSVPTVSGQALGILLESGAGHVPEPALEQVVSFIGAGIYEETLFRLLLFSILAWGLRLVDVPWLFAGAAAALASALLFAAAHNLGPNGEPFDNYVFAFRTLAGIYFTLLYRYRGFGIAVGAHTSYDVLVGTLAL
jgi:membrane protease YdiL (CAAX protease family)